MIIQQHPVDGYLEISFAAETVTLRCHWPADFDSNEWIDISNSFDRERYARMVGDAMTAGAGEVAGIAGGYLTIRVAGDGCTIELSRPQGGWSAASLRFLVRRPCGELLPQADETAPAAALSAGPQGPVREVA